MSPRRGKEQQQGPLKGHFKAGRVYRPSLMAYSETRLSDWVKEDLPDLLWPMVLVWLHGDAAAGRYNRFQQLAIDAAGDDLKGTQAAFDGRLTSLEAVPAGHRNRLLAALVDEPAFRAVIPSEVLAVLRLYEDIPGGWLLVDPWADERLDINADDAATSLARAMVAVVGDRHLNALVKTAPFGWLLLHGKLRLGDHADVLIDYPTNEAKRAKADAFILSSFLSFKAMDEQTQDQRQEWARTFWGQNWHAFECWAEELMDGEPDDDEHTARVGVADENGDAEGTDTKSTHQHDTGENGDEGNVRAVAEQAMRDVSAMFSDFLHRALDPAMPVDLFHPAKHEVACGLASRCARSVLATLRAPHTWNGEHGMATSRILAETLIVLAWMRTQSDDIYGKYQNYGRGKAKLMALHNEQLADRNTPEGRELAERAAAQMREKYGGGDGAAEFQDVSVEATFSGTTLRQMALEAGMDDVYRHVFQPASGISHGEWWALEEYAVQRCKNPLHLFHRIPSFDPDFPITIEFGPYLVRMLETVLLSVMETLGMEFDEEEGSNAESG